MTTSRPKTSEREFQYTIQTSTQPNLGFEAAQRLGLSPSSRTSPRFRWQAPPRCCGGRPVTAARFAALRPGGAKETTRRPQIPSGRENKGIPVLVEFEGEAFPQKKEKGRHWAEDTVCQLEGLNYF